MLKRNGADLSLHGFICGVELEKGTDAAFIAGRLKEGIMWIEGVGDIEVEHMGEIHVYPEKTKEVNQNEVATKSTSNS